MADTSPSLLQCLRHQPDGDAWRRLVSIYTPLLQQWLGRYGLQSSDVDDMSQEVLAVVVRELPHFEHNHRPGAFRRWLRTILVNRLRGFWRARQSRPPATGDSDSAAVLAQLEDRDSALSRLWDREHDRHVMARLFKQGGKAVVDAAVVSKQTTQRFELKAGDGEIELHEGLDDLPFQPTPFQLFPGEKTAVDAGLLLGNCRRTVEHDHQAIQGLWVAVSGERGGKALKPDELNAIRLGFATEGVNVAVPPMVPGQPPGDEKEWRFPPHAGINVAVPPAWGPPGFSGLGGGSFMLLPLGQRKHLTIMGERWPSNLATSGPYRLQGDQLILCLPGNDRQAFPSDLRTKNGVLEGGFATIFGVNREPTTQVLLVLRRHPHAKLVEGRWVTDAP